MLFIANSGSPADAQYLHPRLRDEDSLVRRYAEQGLWQVWARSGEAGIDALMSRSAAAMQAARYPEAIELLSSVVEARPDFAEGWNRRATVYYLAGELRKSIADCDEVLKRNPLHFGALSGLGQIYVQLEDYETALRWFERALEVNPNMSGVELNIELIRQWQQRRGARPI